MRIVEVVLLSSSVGLLACGSPGANGIGQSRQAISGCSYQTQEFLAEVSGPCTWDNAQAALAAVDQQCQQFNGQPCCATDWSCSAYGPSPSVTAYGWANSQPTYCQGNCGYYMQDTSGFIVCSCRSDCISSISVTGGDTCCSDYTTYCAP